MQLVSHLLIYNPHLKVGYIEPVAGEIGRAMKVEGNVVEELKRLCKDFGVELSIYNNFVNIYPKGLGSLSPLFVVSPNSGLISTPAVSLKDMSFDALLDIRYQPFQKVVVESFGRALEGDYIYDIPLTVGTNTILILNVTHSGDTHSSTWKSSVRGLIYRGN
jgi:hypothetical protein